MAEVTEWANGNGYTVTLTVAETQELMKTLTKQLRAGFINLEQQIEFELENK